MKFGITNEASLMALLFSITLFLDVGLADLNIIPRPTLAGNIPILTILVGLVFLGVFIKEVKK